MSEDIYEKMKTLPSTWWQNASSATALVEWFKFHVIGLLMAGTLANEWQYDVFSGFLLQQSTVLLWVTAGHVIDRVSEILSSADFKITLFTWLDWYDKPGAEGVRVHNRDLLMKSWKSEGLDLGVVAIQGLDAGNIRANEAVRPLDERVWRTLRSTTIEGHYLIGFPSAWTEVTSRTERNATVRRRIKADIACLPVGVLPPDESDQGHGRKLFPAKVLPYLDMPEFEVDDIGGMSGGPLLSVGRTDKGQVAYRLVGLEATWRRSDSRIQVVPIASIVPALETWVQQNFPEEAQ